MNYLSSIALSPSRSLLLYILLVSLSSLSLYLLSLYHLDDVGRCGWSANLGRRIQTGRAGRDGTGPHQSPAIFDESICWVRPGRVCRFGFVDRQVMGSLSPVAGYSPRVHLLGSATPSPQVRVRRIRDFGFSESLTSRSLAIFDESICWVRPGRVCRFGRQIRSLQPTQQHEWDN